MSMLVQYVRDDVTNKPKACVVAVGPKQIGVAICHKNDTFNKQRAMEIARGRAIKGSDVMLPAFKSPTMMGTMLRAMDRMDERSMKYFK